MRAALRKAEPFCSSSFFFILFDIFKGTTRLLSVHIAFAPVFYNDSIGAVKDSLRSLPLRPALAFSGEIA